MEINLYNDIYHPAPMAPRVILVLNFSQNLNIKTMNPNYPIRSIMTTNLITAKENSSLEAIRDIFSMHSFHHLPVVGDMGNLLGIISREDFFKVAYVFTTDSLPGSSEAELRFKQLRAADIMTKYPLHLDPDDTVGLAADIFLANKFHALPIVEDGKLIGIVTSHDLLAYSFNSPVDEDLELAEYDEE
jgi:CBS domain-containing protein